MRWLSTAGFLSLAVAVVALLFKPGPQWSEKQRQTLQSMALPMPTERGDPEAHRPLADFGHQLFFDPLLSGDGRTACVSCHEPDRYFAEPDARLLVAGGRHRNAPTLVGVSAHTWFGWLGAHDSLWAQSLAPLDNAAIQGASRVDYARHIQQRHAQTYARLFGPLKADFLDVGRFPTGSGPRAGNGGRAVWSAMGAAERDRVNEVFVNIGKALAAYQAQLQPAAGRFDRYVYSLAAGAPDGSILNASEQRGLALFIGPAQCTNCHFGPALSNGGFHSVGVAPAIWNLSLAEDRLDGVRRYRSSEHRCDGKWGSETECAQVRYAKLCGEELQGAVRTPGLRGLRRTAPYMSQGQFGTLEQVVAHYSDALDFAAEGHVDIVPLHLDVQQQADLVAFLLSIGDGIEAPRRYLAPPQARGAALPVRPLSRR